MGGVWRGCEVESMCQWEEWLEWGWSLCVGGWSGGGEGVRWNLCDSGWERMGQYIGSGGMYEECEGVRVCGGVVGS